MTGCDHIPIAWCEQCGGPGRQCRVVWVDNSASIRVLEVCFPCWHRTVSEIQSGEGSAFDRFNQNPYAEVTLEYRNML